MTPNLEIRLFRFTIHVVNHNIYEAYYVCLVAYTNNVPALVIFRTVMIRMFNSGTILMNERENEWTKGMFEWALDVRMHGKF